MGKGNRYDIADEITEALKSYSNELVRRINVSAETCSEKLRKALTQTSPKRKGKYSKGWKVKKANISKYMLGKFVVYNKTEYRLTHLLEYGHAINGGTKRVAPHPHIAQAKENAVNEFLQDVEKAVEEAGNG